jgi:hypothetical protein
VNTFLKNAGECLVCATPFGSMFGPRVLAAHAVGEPEIKLDRHVTDMRTREVTVNASLFYAYPAALIEKTQFGSLIHRPMEWFLRDLASLATQTHPQLLLCWLRDALVPAADASSIHLFTGAAYWRSTWTIARAHLIAPHGYRYLTLGFVDKPDPGWIAIGARHIQVWDRDYRHLVDDNSYARDDKVVA